MENEQIILQPKKRIFVPSNATPQANAKLLKIIKVTFMNPLEEWVLNPVWTQRTLQKIEKYLNENADPNNKIGLGDEKTVLSLAVTYQIKPLFDLLLNYGADINDSNNHQKTPLHVLITNFKNNPTILSVEYLLQHGANPNVQSDWKETPLSLAMLHWHSDYIEPLIKYGANVNYNNGTNTPLGRAISFSDWSGTNKTKLLLQARASLIDVNNKKDTVFHAIARFYTKEKKKKEFIEFVMLYAQPSPLHKKTSTDTILETLLVLRKYYVTILPELQFYILAKLLQLNCFHKGLYDELILKLNYKPCPLLQTNNHIESLKNILQIKNSENKTPLEQYIQKYGSQLHEVEPPSKEIIALFNCSKLDNDLNELHKMYPDIQTISKDNLALAIYKKYLTNK